MFFPFLRRCFLLSAADPSGVGATGEVSEASLMPYCGALVRLLRLF
jgi:hypothetical protein